MNKELQKILNQMEATLELWKTLKGVKDSYLEFREKDIKLLYDYITNLQDDYEKEHYLVDKLTRQLNDEYKNTEYQCKQKMIYKSRNEKAIEKLESIRTFGLRSGKTLFSTLINESIDILQGSDKDE